MIPPIKRINKIGKPLLMDLQKNTITYLLKKKYEMRESCFWITLLYFFLPIISTASPWASSGTACYFPLNELGFFAVTKREIGRITCNTFQKFWKYIKSEILASNSLTIGNILST